MARRARAAAEDGRFKGRDELAAIYHDEAGLTPGPAPIATDAAPAPNSGAADANSAPDVADPPSQGCPMGLHICNGVCVSLTDPVYGCGDPSCAPCASTHSTMACAGRKCIVGSCDPGYANCNADPKDGCEVDFSKPETCGACNAACGVATPTPKSGFGLVAGRQVPKPGS